MDAKDVREEHRRRALAGHCLHERTQVHIVRLRRREAGYALEECVRPARPLLEHFWARMLQSHQEGVAAQGSLSVLWRTGEH